LVRTTYDFYSRENRSRKATSRNLILPRLRRANNQIGASVFALWYLYVDSFESGGNRPYRRPTEIRFLPNSRASRDHAPGPSIAKPAAIVVTMMSSQISPMLVSASQSSAIAVTTPANGVHKPRSRSTPAAAARNRGASCSNRNPAGTLRASKIKYAQTAIRSSRSPLPGQPLANVENRRCRAVPDLIL
jgi:hypothetical protein